MAKPRVAEKEASAIFTLVLLILLALVAFLATYTTVQALYGPDADDAAADAAADAELGESDDEGAEHAADGGSSGGGGAAADGGGAADGDSSKGNVNDLCRGMPHWELWGQPVKWGPNNLQDTTAACCQSCRDMCPKGGKCECNSWVYCGNKERCGEQHRQCWLKLQEDPLRPEVHADAGVPWTSGLLYGTGAGIITLGTPEGKIRVKLRPEWAPSAVSYLRDLLQLRHCTGCQFYRAEGLGAAWAADGTPVDGEAPGPPYALLQGTLATDGIPYREIEREAAPIVERGMLCLIGGGPDFFISLARHVEWQHGHTVFGQVLKQDMAIVEKIVEKKTKAETWGQVNVRVLEAPVSFTVSRTDAKNLGKEDF